MPPVDAGKAPARNRSHLRRALAAAALAALGCQSSTDPAPAPAPDVTGRWAMFAFEDPVAVDIQQAGKDLGGNGCCGGLGSNPLIACCGAVSGEVLDRRASFGFSFGLGGEAYDYTTDAFVSADGKRMAGTFSRIDTPVAWVRIGAAAPYLASTPALESVLLARAGRYVLSLSSGPAPGADFSAQQTYALSVSGQFVLGQLGSFWGGEMAWSPDQHTLTVGPVPETDPRLPVALSLRFEGTTLASVDATMASGARYQFQAVAVRP